MRKSGAKNLTFTQRLQIETLFNAKLSNRAIAQQVGISLRTVQRELKRGAYEHLVKNSDFWSDTKYKKVLRYSAQIAHDKYKYNCTAKGRPLKIGNDHELINYINNRVASEIITPHAVWGEIHHKKIPFKTNFSKTTLYKYIDLGLIQNKVLGTYKKNTSARLNRRKESVAAYL